MRVERLFAMIEPALRGFTSTDAPSASIYNQCVRCGLCLPTCPTYLETMTETSGPRGRISLIKSVGEGTLDLLSPGFTYQMSECLDCRACEAVCPSGVHYGQLVETARNQIERGAEPRRSPLQNALRRLVLWTLFANLWVMRVVAAFTRFYQRSGLQQVARKSGLLRLLKLERLESFAPRISDRFITARDQRFEANPSRATVMLHLGCVMHVAFTPVHEATIRVLQKNHCTVLLAEGQGCCGAIDVHAGEMAWGKEFARRNIAAFERSGAEYYLVNAAGCGSMLKEYGEVLADDAAWALRARTFSSKVRDILEFLDDIGLEGELGRVDRSVTYQEPCHLAHAQRITAAPRRLLRAIPGLELREMNESSVCCGSAGVYNVTQPEMSERLKRRKIANACATDAHTIATANPGCALQLESGLRESSAQLDVVHVIELLDEAYRN
ncbi:MAG: 4Fe-4S dicluster domain-containing protein [Candidatus Eremiobacteraeota bacterium]|nr:4Fe-4S dicluster domain-containing protein [Candidatus Eremiobacteraeota bacterium]